MLNFYSTYHISYTRTCINPYLRNGTLFSEISVVQILLFRLYKQNNCYLNVAFWFTLERNKHTERSQFVRGHHLLCLRSNKRPKLCDQSVPFVTFTWSRGKVTTGPPGQIPAQPCLGQLLSFDLQLLCYKVRTIGSSVHNSTFPDAG